MKNVDVKGIVWLLSLAMLMQCSKDNKVTPAVSITSVTPTSGSVGSQVVIVGKGFGASAGDNIVKFNGTIAPVLTASTTQVTVEVPTGATSGPISLQVQVGTNIANGPVFTVTAPTVTTTYYVKFKANGVLKIFGDSNPGFQSCGNAACCAIPALNLNRTSSLQISKQDNNWVVASDIVGWNKKQIKFSKTTFPFASFYYNEDGVDYGTDGVADQTGSVVNITNVVSDGDIGDKHSYKVTGTFNCKVTADSKTTVITVTEGDFVVKYTEDY